MDNNWIKCILAGRGGTSSEALIRLIVEGEGTATQTVGSTFDPSGYIFKTMTNMGVVQTLSNNDSELAFYTNQAYTDTILKADTKIIYVKYRNVSTTITLTETPSKKIIPITFKNNRWELNNCPTYNGEEQTIDFESIGLIPENEQPISGTNVIAGGYTVNIKSINNDWKVPSPSGSVESVYWNILPANQRINFSLSSDISITEQSITVTQKSTQCTIPVSITTTNNIPADYNVTVTHPQNGKLIVNFDDKGLYLDFSKGNVKDQLNYYAGNIRFSSVNFVYDFYLNDIKLDVENNTFNIITNITKYGVITDDWNTIISNPDGYELGAIKVLEAESGKEIAGTAQWQMQLVNKTDDGILTFYSTNTSTNEVNNTGRDLDYVIAADFKNFVNDSNVLKVPSSYNCEIDDTYTSSYSISNSSKFWIGTPSQLGYEDSGITEFSKFNLVNQKKNHWLAGHVFAFEASSNGDFYIDSNSTLNITQENVSYPIRLGFSISKDMTANVPTITEGATLNDLNNFIKAKKAGAPATYESKEFRPGSSFNALEKFKLNDGTVLKGKVYITDIDKTNNIVTLQSSYLMKDEDIYLIKISGDSSTEFSEFNAAESYEASNLCRYYNTISPQTDGVLKTNTIEVQNYAYATNEQHINGQTTYAYDLVSSGKKQVTVGSCYPPSATELGLKNCIFTSYNKTYKYTISNSAKIGIASQYPIGDQEQLKRMFNVSNSPSWWVRLRDNLNTSTAIPVYKEGTLGINNGVLERVNPGGYDNTKLHARYHYYALTPRFKIGG